MKKNILIAAFMAIVGIGVVVSQHPFSSTDKESSITLKNLDALANGENSGCDFNEVKKNEKKHSISCSGIGHQCCKFD